MNGLGCGKTLFCNMSCFENVWLSEDDVKDLLPVILHHKDFLLRAIKYLEKQNEEGLFNNDIVTYRNKLLACDHFIKYSKARLSITI